MTPKQIVAKSAKMLDKKLPGWARKIKLTNFTIDSNTNCILGQLGNGEPYTTLKKLEISQDQAVDMGFIVIKENLDELWKSEVRKRRK